MVSPPVNINDVPQAIQLALGPAFLLTGIAGILNVMTGRLARIVDRGRLLTEGDATRETSRGDLINDELIGLELRGRFAGLAIAACTFSALLVCMVITSLFLEVLLDVPLRWLVAALFSGATLALVVGLAYFLREVRLATKTIRIRVVAAER
jgi:hypothetical protein